MRENAEQQNQTVEMDPTESHNGSIKQTGERRLLVAILERALLDLQSEDEKLRIPALDWLSEPYTESPETFSFQFICWELDYDYAAFKESILRLTTRKIN